MTRQRKLLMWLAVVTGVGLLTIRTFSAINVSQQEAIAQVEHLGGHVVTTDGTPAWLRTLLRGRSLAIFRNVTIAHLAETETGDADLACLEALDGLERLNLNNTAITDTGLMTIAELSHLKALDLSMTAISSRGVKLLQALEPLEYLYLSHTRVDNASVPALCRLNHLQFLAVDGTGISPAGVNQLRKQLPQTRIVY